jgi:hypothetical protein
MNKPFFGYGKLKDGNEICTDCHGKIDMEDVRKFSSAEVKLIFLGEKTPGEIVKDRLKAEMGLESKQESIQESIQESANPKLDRNPEEKQSPEARKKKSLIRKVWKIYREADDTRRDAIHKVSSFAIVCVIGLFLWGYFSTYSHFTRIESVNDVEEHAVGTWIGDEFIMSGLPRSWTKYVLRSDHTFVGYYGDPINESNWGPADISGSWKAGSDKYYDTGKQYFYVQFSWNGNVAQYPIEYKKLQVRYIGGEYGAELEKGADDPFLKE